MAQIGCAVAAIASLPGIVLAFVYLLIAGAGVLTWDDLWRGWLIGMVITMAASIVFTSTFKETPLSEKVFMIAVALFAAIATAVPIVVLAGIPD